MSEAHIEALTRLAAQHRAANDMRITKLKGSVTFLQKLLAEREERDAAIISAMNEDRLALTNAVQQAINETMGVVAELSGAPKHVEHRGTEQITQQAAE